MKANPLEVSDIKPQGGRPLDELDLVIFSARLNGRKFFFNTYSKLAELTPESPYYDVEITSIGKKALRDPTLIKFTSDEMAAVRNAILAYFREHGQSPGLKPPGKVTFG